MKTRTVKVIGRLFAENAEYRVIRVENLGGGFSDNATGFTVVPGFATSVDGRIIYTAPIFLVSTSWTLEYCDAEEIEVEDTTGEEVNVIELDIPEPSDISDAEWERMLNDVDTQSNTQENVE